MLQLFLKEIKMKEDKKIDYDGLPYWIMEFCAKNQKSGRLTCALYTDDFQYSDWQKILPQEWIDDAIKNGDVNMALEKYFNVMGDLELLFSELCYFHIDNSGSFPEQILYIRLKTEDVIEMNYLVGQGSEFYITLTEEVNNLPFIIDWNDAVNLTKLTTFVQAKWYYEKMLSIANSQQKEFLLKNKDKIFFLLGLSVIRYGFVERINFNKLEEALIWENVFPN